MGIEVQLFLASDTPFSYFHQKIIRRLNKWAWSLRLVKKGVGIFLDHPLRWENIVSDKLYQCYATFKPELLFFIQEPSYGAHGNKVLEKITSTKIGWYVESFDDVSRLKDSSRYFDFYNLFHLKGVNLLRAEHIQADYLSHAVSPKRFHPLPDQQALYDICFVGNFSPWRDEVLKTALSISKNIALYGPNWLKAGKSKISKDDLAHIYKGESIIGEDLNVLFNSSKIVLNASRFRSSAGLNMRFFEVLATGACLLTDAPPELERHFIKDQHLVTFSNPEELTFNLKKLLNDLPLRQRIGQAGYQEVISHHTYQHLAEKIILQYDALCDKE